MTEPNPQPDLVLALALACYSDKAAYATPKCAAARGGDLALQSYPQCVDWMRGAIVLHKGPPNAVGLFCTISGS